MTVYRRAPGAVWRRLPDGIVVRRPGPDGDAVTLTGAAADLWIALASPTSIDDLRHAVALADSTIEMLVAAGLATPAAQLQ